MEKIKQTKRIDQNSLRWKFIPYIFVMAIAMLVGNAFIGLSTNRIQDYLRQNYAQEEQKVYDERLYSESGALQMYMRMEESYIWSKDIFKVLYRASDIGQVVLGVVWVFVCLFIPGALFYRRHLKEPLRLLMNGADQIGKNNLDFQIAYSCKDEMGQLCGAFEKMRLALCENNMQMWRQMEERRRLNAAFAHDLRTPLTVLKGQADMMIRFVPDGRMTEEKIVSTAVTMRCHIGRLEEYVQTMNHLQRLEDIEIQKEEVQVQALVMQLEEVGKAICERADGEVRQKKAGEQRDGMQETSGEHGTDETVRFEIDCSRLRASTLLVDADIVLQVCENLFSNAARYARSSVTAVLSDERGLTVTVYDDGPGFSDEALEKADQPFYHAGREADGGHMGMGLHICRILCEKHGGYLHLSNREKGACVKAGF